MVIIKPKELSRTIWDNEYSIGMWRHYENGRPPRGRATLKIKLGKKAKLVPGKIEEEVYTSRNSLSDYLYEYTFVPNNERGKLLLLLATKL